MAKQKSKWGCGRIVLGAVAVVIVGLGIGNAVIESREKQTREERVEKFKREYAEEDRNAEQEARSEPPSKPRPSSFELPEPALQGIISTMKGYGARDAAVSVKDGGQTVNLAIEVNFGTSKEKAREMCDNFLRQIAALSNDKDPGQEIGPGLFSYNVGAFTPDREWLVQGAKVRGARRITW